MASGWGVWPAGLRGAAQSVFTLCTLAMMYGKQRAREVERRGRGELGRVAWVGDSETLAMDLGSRFSKPSLLFFQLIIINVKKKEQMDS